MCCCDEEADDDKGNRVFQENIYNLMTTESDIQNLLNKFIEVFTIEMKKIKEIK